VNGLEPTALLNQELDLMPTQEKQPNQVLFDYRKKWISNAGFCSLFIVFARIEMIKYYWFHHRK
jgi:hypothetical protein